MKNTHFICLLPFALFFVVYLCLGAVLDLRDLPGAAGTLHLYEAMKGAQKADEINKVYLYLNHKGYPFERSVWLCSIMGVLGIWIGLLSGAWALEGKKGVWHMGWLLLFWPPLYVYGLNIGVDSFAVGLAFFASGLVWLIFRLPILGVLLCIPAVYILKYALSLKLLVAPVWIGAALAPVAIQKFQKKHVLLLLCCGLTMYLSFPNIGGDGQLQGGLRIPELDWLPIAMGWDRLQRLPSMGMPEGKWDQLIMLCAFGAFWVRRRRLLFVPIVVLSCLVLVVSAFILEQRLGTRLLAPASFAVLVMITPTLIRFRWLSGIICAAFFIELWAFVDQLQERRVMWAQAQALPVPAAPTLWKSQYPENPTIFKGLSFYGAVRAREIITQGMGPVYIMRLRDGRETGPLVYSILAGREARVLDTKACCGKYATASCAKQLVSKIVDKGGMVILPTLSDSWERIYKNEKRWNTHLLQALKMEEQVQVEKNWVWISGKNVKIDSSWPCQP